MWLHGQGFPKGGDISKLIDKQNEDKREVLGEVVYADGRVHHSTAPELFGRQPKQRTITAAASEQSQPWSGHKTQLKPAWEPCLAFRAPRGGMTFADLALEYGAGALNVDGGRIGSDGGTKTVVPAPKGSAATNTYGKGIHGHKSAAIANLGRYPANLLLDDITAPMLDEQSRFFYCAKASKLERNGGLGTSTNNHPCVKPVNLCKYLATLILPPSSVETRRLLVPFSGSGSEMIAALLAGWDEVTGVEMDADYCEIAAKRLGHYLAAHTHV